MNKKAQVTIFIIIGIILVASVVLYFIFRGGITQSYAISDTGNVKNFVDSCVEEVSSEVVERVGLGGGYYYAQENSLNGVTLYYSESIDKSFIPTKEDIEQEISNYITENLFFCTGSFNDFPDLEISAEDLNVLTTIGEENINLNIIYPIRVAKGEDADVLRDFDVRVPVRLGIIYDSLGKLVDDNKEGICLNCILDNDLKLNISNLEENDFMFRIIDEESKLNDKSYEWDFAMEYEYQNVSA